MSNSLLLRLFQSSFFNSWLAVSYLFKYPDSVGIQHYLTDQLSQFPTEEIEFFLPQLCHLLLTRPTDSVALECFIINKCEQSTHIAMLTLWYFQAYLSDLSLNPRSPSFAICKRMYNKCQCIVFGDSVDSPLDGADATSHPSMPTNKVNEDLPSALAGIGLILAGIAQPLFSSKVGQVAIAEGRKQRAMSIGKMISTRQSMESKSPLPPFGAESSNKNSSKVLSSFEEAFGTEINISSSIDDDSSSLNIILTNPLASDFEHDSISSRVDSLHERPPLTASTSHPNLSSVLGKTMLYRPRKKPNGGSLGDIHIRPRPLTVHSSMLRTRSQSRLSSPISMDDDDFDDETILSRYDSSIQQRLLKGNYFRSEMQFILALQDISTRLIIVPKPARPSALRAELSILNNNLPAEVCIPLWCPSGRDCPVHHRVVRISPDDAVVLNSADRAPYLLMVEVLEGDLTFDPTKAANKQSLQRIIREKRKSKRNRSVDSTKSQKPSDLVPIVIPSSSNATFVMQNEVDIVDSPLLDEFKGSLPKGSVSPEVYNRSKIVPSTNTSSPGSLSISRWETSPRGSDDLLKISVSSLDSRNLDISMQPRTPSAYSSVAHHLRVQKRRQDPEHDEFADSMRTAAIMLAQLNSTSLRGQASIPYSGSSTNLSSQVSLGEKTGSNLNLSHGAGMSISGGTSFQNKSQMEAIRQRIMREMMLLEERRMIKMRKEGFESGVGGAGGEGGGGEKLEDEEKVHQQASLNREDPSAAVFRENWVQKRERIRQSSPYGHLSNWSVFSVIVKTGADLRQEQLACQMIKEMMRIWEESKVPIWMRYMRILVTSDSSGLIETIENAISIHSIKKDAYARCLNEKGFVFTLYDYFVKTYGNPTTEMFAKAQDNFMRSLAAYSIASYVLQIKDRHNGNILIDADGHCIHIDFGFMLSNSPGSMGFEAAPFKLTQEYLDILGGIDSEKFAEFKSLMKTAFLLLRKHAENLVLLVEMMQKDSKLPCFVTGDATSSYLRDRFQLSLTEPQVEEFVDKLIMSAACSVYTRLYDTYQYYTQGIF